MLVNMENLSKTYTCDDTTIYALNKINLKINAGEFVTIIGRSGSGKSTLMNILGALDTQSSGIYCLMGKEISGMNKNKISEIRNREIGFIFQGFNLIPTLSALENVELPLIYRKIPKNERINAAKESLSKVGLYNRLHHKPSQMSGGQQQRVAIARAICGNPSIILADEPTGNLDFACGNDIITILKNLNQNNKTVILITHDNKLAKISPRVIKIHDGKIVNDSAG